MSTSDMFESILATPHTATPTGEFGRFEGSAVVHVSNLGGDGAAPVVTEVTPAVVVVDRHGVRAVDDSVEWTWSAVDMSAVLHGADGGWTVFVIPELTGFGVRVPAHQVDAFRSALLAVPGIAAKVAPSVPAVPPTTSATPAVTAPSTLLPSPEPATSVRTEEAATVVQPQDRGDAPSPTTPAPMTPAPTTTPAPSARTTPALAGIEARNISAWFGNHQVLDRVSLEMPPGEVTALIGPSGCGKSTFLRILNRMHEMIPSAAMAGEVLVDGHDIYDPNRKLTEARREVGMVFQKPNPFPAMSIYDNVIASLRLTGTKASDAAKDELVESCLVKAGLWNEVKDRLRKPGGGLSGGQQQRLCIARALAMRPRVLLMDEPCSALDPTSTRRIEETIIDLAVEVTIVIVTHNMQQAARVSNRCAFFLAEQGAPGYIVEHGPTRAMFSHPQDPRTNDYVNGRFG